MRKNSLKIFSLVIAVAMVVCATPSAVRSAEEPRPNVLLIMADDMGFSDAGCYGGEIQTPNLDGLAANGVRFTQFYNTARCWPTRAAALTGYYAQQVRRDNLPGIKSGSQGVRPPWARLLPEMLRPLGYRSYHSGKWHVDGLPLEGGFDRSYSLNDHDRHFGPKRHTEDDKTLPEVDAAKGEYYSSMAIADHAIRCLKEHAEKFGDRPFFEFLAFTAPHFPVQAPKEDIEKYRNKYLAGWDVMREKRWEKMQALKMTGASLSAIEREIGPPYDRPEAMKKLGPNEVNRPVAWESLTAEQKEFQACKMAVHAAMVDRMDREIGRVVEQIKAMGAMENTIIFFMSDNGASAEIMVRGDGHDQHAECGTGATFLSIGPGWSSLANTPFRRHKTWVHEGGIATPLIVNWPKGITARGEMRHTPGHVIDLVPTILEVAGGKAPAEWDGKPVPKLPGKSLLPVLAKDETVARESLWWMHEGNRALRMGDWKIVAAGRQGAWELYDLSLDRCETKDLAAEKPEKVRELAAMWEKQLEETKSLAKADLPAAGVQGVPRTDRNSQIAHQQLVEKAKKGGIDVYFAGDSITRRWGASDRQYRELLANWRENFHGWNAGNFGWGGDRVENILWRLENGELGGVNPKVIVLMAGTNNVGNAGPSSADEANIDEVGGGIAAILEVMRKKAPGAVIVLMGITPRNDGPGGVGTVATITKINERLERLADGKTVRFLNLNAKLARADGTLHEGMTVDGLHLSVKGYQVWADALRPILEEILGPRGKNDRAPEPTGGSECNRALMSRSDEQWPFDQPRNCAVLTLRSIIFGAEPILLVCHDEDDHGWQFLNGRTPTVADAAVVGLREIVQLDPSVLEVADLPPGWQAARDTKASRWRRFRRIAAD